MVQTGKTLVNTVPYGWRRQGGRADLGGHRKSGGRESGGTSTSRTTMRWARIRRGGARDGQDRGPSKRPCHRSLQKGRRSHPHPRQPAAYPRGEIAEPVRPPESRGRVAQDEP